MDSDRSDDQPAADQSEKSTPAVDPSGQQRAPWERGVEAGTTPVPAADPWQQQPSTGGYPAPPPGAEQSGFAQPGFEQSGFAQSGFGGYGQPAGPLVQHPGGGQIAAPPAQMWLPPGQYLAPSTWRRRWKTPVIVGSALVGTLMAAVTVFALVVGSAVSAVFTARGAVVVDCQTQATYQQSIHVGSTVQIWGETGNLESSTRLEDLKSANSQSGTRVCFLPFAASKVPATQVGFNVRIGGYTQFVTASALKSGVVIRPR